MNIVLLEPLGVSDTLMERLASDLAERGHLFSSYPGSLDEAENILRLRDGDIAIVANMPLSGSVIKSSPRLKMISVAFTGYDHVDMDACASKNVVVSNCAGYSTDSVAELALGLALSVARKIVSCDGAVRGGKTKNGLLGHELAGKTVGIVGTGAIGMRVARVFGALGCRVIAFSRTARRDAISDGIEYVSLEELLSSSDLVSLHLPCNAETIGLIDAERIGLMKPSAILINTARGPLVDNGALAAALKSGAIAGAGIDVFDMEPPIPSDYPLLSAPNCVFTPHVAFATPEALEKRAVMAFDNVVSWIEGKPVNVVS